MADIKISDDIIKLAVVFKDVLHGGIGSIIAYLFLVSKTKQFSSYMLFVYLVVGAFIGYVFGSFLPKDLEYRDGLISLISIASYTLFGTLESKIVQSVLNKYVDKYLKD